MVGIGTAVTGGMLSATFIDLIFIPLFFVMISERFSKEPPDKPPVPSSERTSPDEPSSLTPVSAEVE
jgi:hypothetical protein